MPVFKLSVMKLESNTLAASVIGAFGAVLVVVSLTGLAICHLVCQLRPYDYSQISPFNEQLVIWFTYLPWFCAVGIGLAVTAYFVRRGSRLSRALAVAMCITTYVLFISLFYSYLVSDALYSFPIPVAAQNIFKVVHSVIVVILATVFLVFAVWLLRKNGASDHGV